MINLARCEEAAAPLRLSSIGADAVYVRSRRRDLAQLLAREVPRCLVVAHFPPVEPSSRPAHVLVCSASDLDPGDAGDLLALGSSVAGPLLRWVLVTRGAAGARASSAGESLELPTEPVATTHTTGAGDAFAAGLVHALVTGRPMGEALAVVLHLGTESTRWESSGLPAEAVRRLLGG